MNQEEIIIVGFDLKSSIYKVRTIDSIVWPGLEGVDCVANKFNLKENSLQLFEGDGIQQMIESADLECEILAVGVSPEGMAILKKNLNNQKIGLYSANRLSSTRWDFIGYDVADADGFFSIFGIDGLVEKLGVVGLIKEYADANHIAIAASNIIHSHSPFIPMALFVAKRSSN